ANLALERGMQLPLLDRLHVDEGWHDAEADDQQVTAHQFEIERDTHGGAFHVVQRPLGSTSAPLDTPWLRTKAEGTGRGRRPLDLGPVENTTTWHRTHEP